MAGAGMQYSLICIASVASALVTQHIAPMASILFLSSAAGCAFLLVFVADMVSKKRNFNEILRQLDSYAKGIIIIFAAGLISYASTLLSCGEYQTAITLLSFLVWTFFVAFYSLGEP